MRVILFISNTYMSVSYNTQNGKKVKYLLLVLGRGLEPPWVAPRAPKARASTISPSQPLPKAYYVLLYFSCGVFLFPHFAPIAQLVEQIPLKDKVPGPSPGGRTRKEQYAVPLLVRSEKVFGAEGGTRTHTGISPLRILSPVRLPFRHLGWRPGRELNPRITVLQTVALPLRHLAVY